MYKLYLVTDDVYKTGLAQAIDKAIQGGVSMVQLRLKNVLGREFLEIAQEVKAVTDRYNVPLIINDRLDVAMLVDAAGVHLGQDDLPLDVVKRIWSQDKIYGVSTKTLEQAQKAEQDGATYIGVGAMFPTNTKVITKSTSKDTLQTILNNVHIPVVAIGGINHNNVHELNGFDLDGVAVVSCILAAQDVLEASKSMQQKLEFIAKT